jgi:hypothetical protein
VEQTENVALAAKNVAKLTENVQSEATNAVKQTAIVESKAQNALMAEKTLKASLEIQSYCSSSENL